MFLGTTESGPNDLNVSSNGKQNTPTVVERTLYSQIERKVSGNESKEYIVEDKQLIPVLPHREKSRDVTFSKAGSQYHGYRQQSDLFFNSQDRNVEKYQHQIPSESLPFFRRKNNELVHKNGMEINHLKYPMSFQPNCNSVPSFNEQCKRYCQFSNGFSMLHENGKGIQESMNKLPAQFENYSSNRCNEMLPSPSLQSSNYSVSKTISYPPISIFSTDLTPQSFSHYCSQTNMDIMRRLKILRTLVNDRSMSRRISRRRNRKLFEVEIELKMLLSISEDLLNIFKSLKCTKEHLQKAISQ